MLQKLKQLQCEKNNFFNQSNKELYLETCEKGWVKKLQYTIMYVCNYCTYL